MHPRCITKAQHPHRGGFNQTQVPPVTDHKYKKVQKRNPMTLLMSEPKSTALHASYEATLS